MKKQPKLNDVPCPFCKEPASADAIRCPHCRADYSPDQVTERKATAKKNSRTLGIGCLIVIAIMFLFVSTCSGDDATDDREKGSVHASNANIAEVTATKETKFASVKVELGEMWKSSHLPVLAAGVVEDAGKAIKAGASDIPPETERVRFWFTGPTIDQYGNEGRGSLIQFEIKTEDLKRVNYGKIAAQSLLEFAYDTEVRFRARQGVSEYCAENIATNPRFCAGRL